MSRTNIAMGVDIGGTHITAALIDLQTRSIIPSSIKRAAVNAGGTADEIIHVWSACISGSKQDTEIDSICIAMPGPFDYEYGISLMRGQDKFENMYDLNIKELLAKSLNNQQQVIFMDNDAACFLQGEVFKGAAGIYDKTTVIGVTLGTGLGSAVYKDGKSRSADMWCWPFKDGIAEDYLCTRWFVKRWYELTGETINGVKELTGLSRTSEHVRIIFKEFGDHLAAFLLDFISTESPEAIVIGGNIAKAFEWFSPTITAMIGAMRPSIKIEQAILGEEAPLLGAVSSWLQNKNHFIHT
jgi:glucokinase